MRARSRESKAYLLFGLGRDLDATGERVRLLREKRGEAGDEAPFSTTRQDGALGLQLKAPLASSRANNAPPHTLWRPAHHAGSRVDGVAKHAVPAIPNKGGGGQAETKETPI